jgi:hypothetical protein
MVGQRGLAERVQHGGRSGGGRSAGADGSGQAPAQPDIVDRDGPHASGPGRNGRRRHQGGAEIPLDELEHQGVVGDLDGRRDGAEDTVDGLPDAPAGRAARDPERVFQTPNVTRSEQGTAAYLAQATRRTVR